MVMLQKDLVYARGDVHPRNVLDLYLPSSGGKHPLIVWVHGGSWVSGDKATMPLGKLLGDGIAIASVNYRFIDEAPVTAPIIDVKNAIRYLRDVADEYDLDRERFIGAGFSAGAHLIALAALTGDSISFAPSDDGAKSSARLRAAAVFGGVYDLTKIAGFSSNEIGSEARVEVNREMVDVAVYGSPITHIGTDDTPPLYIQHGEEDDVVSPSQSLLFAGKLKRAGAPHTLEIVPGLGHKMKLNPRVYGAISALLKT